MSDELERSKPRLEAAQDPEVGELMLPRSLRNSLIRELSPTRTERDRVQAGIVAALGGGVASPFVEQVDAAMATRAAHLKTATVVAGKSIATKLIVSSLVLASAAGVTTSMVLRNRQPARGESATAAPARVERAARDGSAVVAPPPQTAAPPLVAAAPPSGESSAPAAMSPPAAAPDVDAMRDPHVEEAIDVAHPSGTAHRRRVERSPRPTASQLAEASRAPASAPAAAQPAPGAVVVEEPPATPTAQAESAARREPREPAPQPSLTLGDELSLVRGASDALERHDPAKALQLLARYAQNHPNGSLRIEADALRAMALCAGKRPEAAAARDAFLNAHPQSALARRIRSVCTW